MNLTRGPVLALRNAVIYPELTMSFPVTREKSLRAIRSATHDDNLIIVVPQLDSKEEEINISNLSTTGTLCQIVQVIDPLSMHGTVPVRVLLRGLSRFNVSMFYDSGDMIQAQVSNKVEETYDSKEMAFYRKHLTKLCEEYRSHYEAFPEEIIQRAQSLNDERFVDFLAAHFELKHELNLVLLAEPNLVRRAEVLSTALQERLLYIRTDAEVRERVEASFTTRQREQYLREQLHAIQNELGAGDDDIEELTSLAEKSGMPEDVLEKTKKEITRLASMSDFSPEATVSRNWIEWVSALPWKAKSDDNTSLVNAREELDSTHWGLEKVKDRLIEFLAQKALAGQDAPAQILCLVGPPGVGKTSLGKTIAQAMGRKFVSFSMGGMRDESEIRGHRRTYIGSRPGRIIQKLKEAGTNNPVMLLDEVDKLGSDFRGDPASALLEALDPEQNTHFTDHYIEVPFDLSDVLFITTANVLHTIPRPLLDRMEVIQLSGYLPEEKTHIAKDHLLPRLYQEHGLTKKDLTLGAGVIETVIQNYTSESGVRQLKRQLAKLFRKQAVKTLTSIQEHDTRLPKKTLTKKDLPELLGAPRRADQKLPTRPIIGYVNGLAWTEVGGDVLPIEVMVTSGKGGLTLTGNLGDVMKESAQAALSYVRANWKKITKKREPEWDKIQLHLHAPEGAIPKDGPSAGLAIATAMLSALAQLPYNPKVAMTGEINLHGDALAIGGLREKLLAAKRMGVKTVLIPKANHYDLVELDEKLVQGLEVIEVSNVTTVFDHALGKNR